MKTHNVQPLGRPRRRVILLSETSRQWGREIMTGIAKYAKLQGAWSIYRQPPFYRLPLKRKKNNPVLINNNADGVILGGDVDFDLILSLKIPTVLVEVRKTFTGFPDIIGNSPALGKMAAEYFLNLGLKQFAFCGFGDIDWSQDRQQSFCETIEQTGQTVHVFESPISLSLPAWEKEKQMVTEWLISLPKPIGLFACNDDCGQFLLEACSDAEVKVPDEVAVLGVDNDSMICELTDPPLSSIALNVEKSGYEAAAMLDKLMNGETVEHKRIIVEPSHVVPRQSTEILAIDDPKILQAVRFIHKNAALPIQIDDVVQAVDLSRRSLTERFRQILNRSVYDEIRRVRSDRIAQLLLETDIPVHQIAFDMGFTTPEHIARFFKKEKGVTPAEYRKQHQNKRPTF